MEGGGRAQAMSRNGLRGSGVCNRWAVRDGKDSGHVKSLPADLNEPDGALETEKKDQEEGQPGF